MKYVLQKTLFIKKAPTCLLFIRKIYWLFTRFENSRVRDVPFVRVSKESVNSN